MIFDAQDRIPHLLNFYRPQRSCGQGNVLQASVILSTRGCLPQCMLGYHTPWSRHPRSRHPQEADTPPRSRHPPEQTPLSRHPPRSRLRHTVNERPVRIPLEFILVFYNFFYLVMRELMISFYLAFTQSCLGVLLHPVDLIK